MFNLEQAITKWRQQMLAAGIQSPASLNELEIHLREEIERQMRSGSNARTAFEISLQQIGRPEVLSREFKKSEGTTAKTIGYLALGIGTLIMLRLLTIHLVASPLAPEKCGDWRSVLGFLSGQIDAAHWRPNEQYAWLIAAAAIIFFDLCSAIFYFESSDTRSIRLWKTIGLLYSTLAVWLSAGWPLACWLSPVWPSTGWPSLGDSDTWRLPSSIVPATTAGHRVRLSPGNAPHSGIPSLRS